MQNYLGSSNKSETVFFTAETQGTHVYQISGYLTVTGTGDDVTVRLFRNGNSNGLGWNLSGEQGEYLFSYIDVVLTDGDELSFDVNVDGAFSWDLQLRLVRILDELASLE